MFGPIGVPELIIIFIVALVVFGPKKLPELGKSLGHGLREFNKAKNELKATWDEQMREAERHLEGAKDAVNAPARDAIAALNPAAEPTPAEAPLEVPHDASVPPAETPQVSPNVEPPAPEPNTPAVT